jgi:hypothetical protein
MSELLTAAELATDLKMSQQVVLRWHRAGRKFSGMVPTL